MEVGDDELKGGMFTKLSHSFNPDEVDAGDSKGCPKMTSNLQLTKLLRIESPKQLDFCYILLS
jgi:hypothetical protein